MTIRPNSGTSLGETEGLAGRVLPTSVLLNGVSMRILSFAIAAACLLLTTANAQALEEVAPGTSSRSARQEALAAIPYQQINEAALARINPILDRPSIYRRLPVTSINIDPDYFVFLARYPEVIVNIWKIMGITQMTASRTGPFSLSTNDGAGTLSDIELIYGNRNTHIFYGTGSYTGPVFRRELSGQAVIVLQTRHETGADGKPVATSQLDVFLKIDNATAGVVARTVAPIVGSTADHNFVESLKFVQRLNETTINNGPGVQQMAGRLTDISADVRGQFIQVAGDVFTRAGSSVREPVAQPSASYDYSRSSRPMVPRSGVPASLPASNRGSTQPSIQNHGTYQSHPAQNYGYGQPAYSEPAQWQSRGYQTRPADYQSEPRDRRYETPATYQAPPNQPLPAYRPMGVSSMSLQAPQYQQQSIYLR
ncbi:MAG: hypothetical protein AAF456_20920 [Planctomycetota bacterium]